jgi:hypothetical protein
LGLLGLLGSYSTIRTFAGDIRGGHVGVRASAHWQRAIHRLNRVIVANVPHHIISVSTLTSQLDATFIAGKHRWKIVRRNELLFRGDVVNGMCVLHVPIAQFANAIRRTTSAPAPSSHIRVCNINVDHKQDPHSAAASSSSSVSKTDHINVDTDHALLQ